MSEYDMSNPSMFSDESNSRANCFERIPTELIAEILSLACYSPNHPSEIDYGHLARLCLVSWRLHDVAMETPSLWKYIVLNRPPYTYAQARIARAGRLPLDVSVQVPKSGTGVLELKEILMSISSRICTLAYHSVNPPDIFQETLPHLLVLRVELDHYELWTREMVLSNLSSLRLPSLRSLALGRGVRCGNFPETIEELQLDGGGDFQILARVPPLLPPGLRILRLKDVLVKYSSPTDPSNYCELPGLTELHLTGVITESYLSSSRYIRAPSLKKLEVSIPSLASSSSYRGFNHVRWGLRFEELTHVTLRMGVLCPNLDTWLELCSALTHVHIYASCDNQKIVHLARYLLAYPLWLPDLQSLALRGCPVALLQKLADTRPALQRIEVHTLDLGLTNLAEREGFEAHAAKWEKLRATIHLETYDLPDLSSDSVELKYLTWEDMKQGIPIQVNWDITSEEMGNYRSWIFRHNVDH